MPVRESIITINMRDMKSLLLNFILVLIINVYRTQVILMTSAARLKVMLPMFWALIIGSPSVFFHTLFIIVAHTRK